MACVGRHKDIVTEPGGDTTDWFSIDVPRGCPYPMEIEVVNKPARPGMAVYVAFTNDPGHKAGRGHKVGERTGRFTLTEAGRYYLRVSAPRGQAGAYRVNVSMVGPRRCGGEIVLMRPDDATTPAVAGILVPVEEAGAGQNAPASLVVDASDARVQQGMRGVVLDEQGNKIRHSELVIGERVARGDTAFATAEFLRPEDMHMRMLLGWSGWTIALDAQARR